MFVGNESGNSSTTSAMSAIIERIGVPTREALALVTRDQAYACQMVPLRLQDRKLLALATEPVNPDLLRQFAAATCREVEIVHAPAELVKAGLQAAYGPPEFGEVIDLLDAVAARPKVIKRNQELIHVPRMNQGPMKVIAVASGKGGVGKSSTTANLAVALAKRSYRVGLIDCDFGLSNLHVMLGAKPKFTLSDVLAGRIDMVSAFELTQGGVYLLAGPTGASEFANLNYASLQAAGAGFSSVNQAFDYLFLDAAAGIHEGVMSLLMAADETVLVTTPDPAAVLDAYVTARTLLDRRPSARIRVLVNQAPNESEAKMIFAKFMTFLGLNSGGRAEFLGKIAADKAAGEAVRARQPVVIGSPRSQAAQDLEAMACKVAELPAEQAAEGGFLSKLFSGLRAA